MPNVTVFATGGAADGSVTTVKLADNAVTNPKMDDDAVDTVEIVDDAVTAPKIADNVDVTAKGFDADKVDGADAGVATGEVFKIPASIAEGDIFQVDSSGNVIRLAAGVSGQFLKTQGAANPAAWDDVSAGGNAIVTTGTYTGDGTTNQEIVVSGITTLKILAIVRLNDTSSTFYKIDQEAAASSHRWDDAVRDLVRFAAGFSGNSFFVDDNGGNSDPNSDGRVYEFYALGV